MVFKIEIDDLAEESIASAVRTIATFLDSWNHVDSVEIFLSTKKTER